MNVSKPGAALKMYNDEWSGKSVKVVEMDGEIDMVILGAPPEEIEWQCRLVSHRAKRWH